MDLKNYYNMDLLQRNSNSINKVFFYRVCGTGMGAAACLLKQAGFEVEGGDHNFGPPMSDYLFNSGVKCHLISDIDFKYLKQFDLIVVGNIVAGKGEEAREIEKLEVPFSSFPSVLGALFLEKIPHVVGIAGTHGKTTTTYLASQLFKNLGENPGYLVGGVIEGEEAAFPGDGKYFFIESDEYETSYFEKFSKFRNYCLNHMVITSLEFDHADIFADMQAINDQFNFVLPKIDKSLILNRDYHEISTLNLPDITTLWYGEQSSTGPMITSMDSKGTTFVIKYEAEKYGFKTNIVGKHNIENLTSIILYALTQNFTQSEIQKGIENLKMVKRRQEVRGTYKGATVIDDFAHHPKAVDVTLETLKVQYPDKKMIVVFGASSATARSDLFQKEFSVAFSSADEVIVVKPSADTNVKGAKNLDSELLSQKLRELGLVSLVTSNLEQLIEAIDDRVTDNSLLVVLSNSNCAGLWESRFADEIK